MAKETYYFFFSIILALGGVFYLASLVYLRSKGRTVFGQYYKPGSAEYKRVVTLASKRNLIITAILTLIFIANLSYDVSRLLHLSNHDYAHGILIYAPIATILFSILMIFVMREQFNKYRPDK